jgi:hypothetical protein
VEVVYVTTVLEEHVAPALIVVVNNNTEFFVVYFMKVSVPWTVMPNDRMNDELWTGKDLERSSHGLIEVLSQCLLGGTE